ncbi:MAG: DUF2807 domain-containing protein [Anaerolineales bacterium]|nr:DUF2807 domain-containing protein [Anaerolineales bacterium]
MTILSTKNGVITQDRPVEPFNRISLEGIGHVMITEGDTPSCRIEAEASIMPYIVTQVINDTLCIRFRRIPFFSLNTNDPINFYVTVTSLNGIELSGAGRITCPQLVADQFDLRLSGAGTAALAVESTEISTRISGASRVQLAGKAVRQSVNISGAGACLAEELASQWCRVRISGAGKARVSVTEHLDASIHGAGSVSYTGNPTIKRKVSGAGRIRQMNMN